MKNLVKLIVIVKSLFALNPIVIKGSKFFDSVTQQQFFIKGISYQPRSQGIYDPLAVANYCRRDIPYLKGLGVNVIRVYEKFGIQDHDECMKMLDQSGIYVILDLPVSFLSVNREYPSYYPEIFDIYKETIDAFSQYNNTLAYIAGNEVAIDFKTTAAASYIKAAIRDSKKYIKENYRPIPVGYADKNNMALRKTVQSYFDCGESASRADFYAINVYSWCGESSFIDSNYDEIRNELSALNVPTFLSGFGCNKVTPRTFKQIDSIFGLDMNEFVSGGILYEFTQEDNKYGVVQIENGQVELLPDFETARDKIMFNSPQKIDMENYEPEEGQKSCPTVNENWQSGQKLPPTPSEAACDCIYSALSCQVNGKGQEPGNSKKVISLVQEYCRHNDCHSILSKAHEGFFGEFSFCPEYVKYSIILTKMVNNRAAVCHFEGLASSTLPTGKNLNECLKLPPRFTPKPPKAYPQDQTDHHRKESLKYTYEEKVDFESSASTSLNSSQLTGLLLLFSLYIFLID